MILALFRDEVKRRPAFFPRRGRVDSAGATGSRARRPQMPTIALMPPNVGICWAGSSGTAESTRSRTRTPTLALRPRNRRTSQRLLVEELKQLGCADAEQSTNGATFSRPFPSIPPCGPLFRRKGGAGHRTCRSHGHLPRNAGRRRQSPVIESYQARHRPSVGSTPGDPVLR